MVEKKKTTKKKKESLEDKVWQMLRTCFDPEIPVNIVDLGLIYAVKIEPLEKGENRVLIEMTLTSPACSMGPMIAEDARQKVLSIAKVKFVDIEFVFDPPWDMSRISDEGKLELGML